MTTKKSDITEEAFTDAPSDVEGFLDAAVNSIDYKFGKGYAKEHPELTGAFIQTCATFIQTREIVHAIDEVSSVIEGNLVQIELKMGLAGAEIEYLNNKFPYLIAAIRGE